MRLDRIMVPVDFSACSRAAVRHALDIAAKYGASVEFIHVYDAPHYARDAMVTSPDQPTLTMNDYLRNQAQEMLADLVSETQGTAEVEHTEHVVGGTPHTTIVGRAKETRVHLIIMGTHGHAGSLKHRLIGSVVDKVLRQSPCPVLVVHEGDNADA